MPLLLLSRFSRLVYSSLRFLVLKKEWKPRATSDIKIWNIHFGSHDRVATQCAQAPGYRDMGDPKWKQLALGLTLAHRAGRDPFQRPQGHSADQGTQAGIWRSITSRDKSEKPISTPPVLSGCAKQEHQRD